jgi:phage terminase large subunit
MITSAAYDLDLSSLPEVTNDRFYSLYWNKNRFLVLYGGAGSGKSEFAAAKHVLRCLTEPGHRFLFVRKVAKTIRNSMFQLVQDVIARWGMDSLFTARYSTLGFECVNGSEIVSAGLDDVEKLKSIVGITGVWIEETTELEAKDLQQLLLRIRGVAPFYKQIILTFNPIVITHWLREYFFANPKPDSHIMHSTFRDNKFLDPEYIQTLANLAKQDAGLYTIYGKGEWGVLQSLLFNPPTIIPESEYPKTFDDEICGLDFGFANEMALLWMGLKDCNPQTGQGKVYHRELLYKSGVTTARLIHLLPGLLPNLHIPIYCDSAEPDRVVELQAAGFNAVDAAKGPGSVITSIDFVRGFTHHTHPGNINLNREFVSYKRREDKDGRIYEEPVKVFDHLMSALRYGLYTHLGGPTIPFQIR